MDLFSDGSIHHLVAAYGYWGLAIVIALESLGLPLPGETVLIAASIYAGSHPDRLNIVGVIAAAMSGAIVGGTMGYWIGRGIGYRLLLTWGPYIGLTEGRIKVGQYLFLEHGTKVVFLGRFIPILRVMAAFLAGMNRMDAWKFFLANALSAAAWAALMGAISYKFGKAFSSASSPLAWGLIAVGIAVLVGTTLFLRSHEAQLEAKAKAALPGPLSPPQSMRAS